MMFNPTTSEAWGKEGKHKWEISIKTKNNRNEKKRFRYIIKKLYQFARTRLRILGFDSTDLQN